MSIFDGIHRLNLQITRYKQRYSMLVKINTGIDYIFLATLVDF